MVSHRFQPVVCCYVLRLAQIFGMRRTESKALMDNGQLVTDELVIALVKETYQIETIAVMVSCWMVPKNNSTS